MEESPVEISAGELCCLDCGAVYPICEGMPHLYVDDEQWAPKAREAEGWVTYHKNLGIYDIADDDRIDIHVPYYPEEPWIGVAHSFDVALELLNLSGDETVLDLGAGRGWAAKHFAQRGCRVVALDVVSDGNVGLGRGRVLMNHAGVYFDRLIGDAERLPFYDNSFDQVFCAATLHHSSDLRLLCRNIARVLKPGGRLCAIREPCISVGDNEQAVLSRDANDEISVGINENRPNLLQYMQALDEAGLDPLHVAPVNAYGLSDVDLRSWGLELGVVAPPVWLDRPRETVERQRRYWRSRWAAIRQGNYLQAQRLMRRFSGRNQVEVGILLWVSGELLLVAAKRVSGEQ
jgi:SAM-dependent methyltransferase